MTTRLLVKSTVAETLPANDQDRVIATELMTSFRLWKSLLGTISQNEILTEKRILMDAPFFYIGKSGENACILKVAGHIDPLDSLPDLTIIHESQYAAINF